MKLSLLRAKKVLIFSGVVIAVVLYDEFGSFSNSWPPVSCDFNGSEDYDCLKLLLVADPQIIGESNHIWNFLEIWDSDRFLRKTYSRVLSHVKPQLVAFLGDLIDQGQAEKYEYMRYALRFKAIFHTAEHIEVIAVTGDNDVSKNGEVNVNFPGPNKMGMIQKHSIDFFMINFDKNIPISYVKGSPFRVLLIHNAFTFLNEKFREKVKAKINPQVVFSGHVHKSYLIKTQYVFNREELSPSNFVLFNLTDGFMMEITVPTCSYRMGVPKMGYGLAVFSSTGRMKYTVLWLPSRFKHLLAYLIFLYTASFILFCLPHGRSFWNLIKRLFP